MCWIWQDLNLGEYPDVNDDWMDVISSQGSSLLSVDISGSEVTDDGLYQLKNCKNIQALNFNYCDQISDDGLEHLSGRTSLCYQITRIWSLYIYRYMNSV